jgi:4-phosphopantoate---beta-alanine ligase
VKISKRHPRFLSLSTRERLAKALFEGFIVPQGLIAHGRGEAFDYLLGEKTTRAGSKATSVAAALLLVANHPVVSVNGNTAALVGKDIIKLASTLQAPIEVNLFHRTAQREKAIARHLTRLGAREVLGVGKEARTIVRGIASPRRRADPRGIGTADVVLVPLEDGDRAEALGRAGKKVIAVDLNPLSRTSRSATVSIVDNVVRVIPNLLRDIAGMRRMPRNKLLAQVNNFDNQRNLAGSIEEMIQYLRGWARN